MEWIGTIIFGAIIGLLGKFVAPGDKDNIPIWLTIVLGIVGALAGYAIWGAISSEGNTGGIDWIRWIISIAVAAVLVMIASTMMGRNTTARR
ncbi:MAG: GlsB/YeaQ/YmgE family stress response membrane protein [Nocardioidaceae bacterium]|nr:GlsB/YeaQ/YmgE family stress response membrane protein [Nocardioidaceae bacterium]